MTTKTKTIGEMTYETNLLIERLAQAQDGDIVTYSELSELIGVSVQLQQPRGWLSSAREFCEREYKIRFDTVPKVGVKRLDSEQWANQVATRPKKKMNRESDRALKSARNLLIHELTNEQRETVTQTVALMGAIKQMTTPVRTQPPAQRRIAESTRVGQQYVPKTS